MLKQRFVIQFGSQFGIKILAMVAGLVVARVAGPEVVGIIAFGTAYVTIWGFITGLFGTGHIKIISEGKPLGDSMATYTWLQGGSILIYTFTVLAVFLFQKFFLHDYFESRTHEIVIFILLLANVATQILDFGNTTFTAKLEQAKANFPLVVKAVIYHLGRIVIVILGFKAIGLASVNLISTLLALPLAWKLLKKLEFGKFNKALFKEHMSYMLPILLVVVIDSIMEYSDKLLLAHYTNTTELGYYSAAFSIGGMFLLISNSVGAIFFPLFSGLISQGDWASVNQKINDFQKFILLFVFPGICLLIIIGSPFLITLIGDKYLPSVMPFKILLFATYLSIVGIPFDNIIFGMGRFYLNAMINLICLIIFIFSIFFLVNPKFLGLGAVGIAINMLILNFTKNFLYLVYSFRLGEINLRASILLPYLIVSIVAFFFIYFEPSLMAWNSFWWLIISPIYIALVYSVLFFFGFFTKNDIEHFIDVLNLKKLHAYVSDELRKKD